MKTKDIIPSPMQIHNPTNPKKVLAKANALRSNLRKRKLQTTQRKLAMDSIKKDE